MFQATQNLRELLLGLASVLPVTRKMLQSDDNDRGRRHLAVTLRWFGIVPPVAPAMLIQKERKRMPSEGDALPTRAGVG